MKRVKRKYYYKGRCPYCGRTHDIRRFVFSRVYDGQRIGILCECGGIFEKVVGEKESVPVCKP